MTTATTVQSRRFGPWLGGLALLGLGATLIVVGSLQTTSSHFGASCPQGTELIAKFKFDHDRNKYVFQSPSGNKDVVKITNGSKSGGDATSSIAIKATVVEGGSHAHIVSYSTPQLTVHFSNSGLPTDHGKKPDITSVQFCGVVPPPPETSAPETSAPETSAPETSAPETSAPETSAPETSAPETSAPDASPTSPQTNPVPVTEPSTPQTQPTDTTASATTSTTTTSVAQESPVVTSTSLVTLGSSDTALPRTGAPSVLLISLGVALMALGLTLTVIGRARDRRARR